jgi:hypothetical protein
MRMLLHLGMKDKVMYQIICWLVYFPTFCLLGSCAASVNYAPTDYCRKEIDPKMARFEFKRESSFFGHQLGVDVFDTDQPVGSLGPGGSVCWDRYPGRAEISCQFTGFAFSLDRSRNVCAELEASAGKKYSFDVSMGPTRPVVRQANQSN